jgi:cytochrome c553
MLKTTLLILALAQGFETQYDAVTIQAGKLLYDQACAKCHGADGRGVSKTDLDIKTDVPDLTRCQDQGEETDYKWLLILSKGGPYVGLSADMPSFELYSEDQRRQVIAYSRTFCKQDWVRGELNFERPLVTAKAYPENEIIISPFIAHSRETGATSVEFKLEMERRIGNRLQFEIAAPLAARQPLSSTHFARGFGDGEIGAKYVIAHSFRNRFIASAGADLSAPTGRASEGIGHGTWIFEPYWAVGKAFGGVIAQSQIKVELPFNRDKAERVFVYNTNVGWRIRPDPRGVFPSLDITGEDHNVALIPQLRYGISKNGKWAIALGVRRPVHGDMSERFAVIGYLLWEYLGR